MLTRRRMYKLLRFGTVLVLLATLLAACGPEAATPTQVAGPATATMAPAAATNTTAPAAATNTTAPAAATNTTTTTEATATTGTASVAVTPDPSISGQLTIWGWEAAINALKVVDPEFQQAYPNIQIEYVPRSPADTYQQLQLAASAGTGLPDISIIEDSHLAQFASLGVLADISDRVQPYVPQFNQYRWQQAMADGKYYAMPWDSGPVAVFYRRDVFEKAGVDPASIATWDDYYQAAKTIKEKTGATMWQQAQARNDARLFEMLMWQEGLGYIDQDGNVILDKEPRIEQILEYMGKFWREGLAADTEPWTDAWYKEMAEGTVATVPGAVWMGTFFKSFIAPEAGGKWGIFRLPAWEAGGSQSSNDGGSSLGIFETSEQKEAAWAYVEFHLGRADAQVKIYEQTDLFPGLQSTYADPAFEEPDPYFANQEARAFFVDVATDIPTAGIYSTNYQEMNSLLAPELQKFALGQQSAKDTLANAARAIRDRTNRQ